MEDDKLSKDSLMVRVAQALQRRLKNDFERSLKPERVLEDAISDISGGLELYTPIVLFIAGLLTYVGLYVKQALQQTSVPSDVPEIFLAINIILITLVPYLFQLIFSRREVQTFPQRLLTTFFGFGAAITIVTVARALLSHGPMLPVATDFISDEIYWMAPLAAFSAFAGGRGAKPKSNAKTW